MRTKTNVKAGAAKSERDCGNESDPELCRCVMGVNEEMTRDRARNNDSV